MKKTYGNRVAAAAASAAFIAGALFSAPIASAADVSSFPEPGSQPANVIYNELKGMGYSVSINWMNSTPSTPLSRCDVTGYHAPGPANSKVYMDVSCASEDY